MKTVAQNLMKKVFTIESVNEQGKKVQTTLAWFSFVEYVQGSGSVQVRFDRALKPYLLGLKECFTEYDFRYLMPMRSRYSIRIYELLKMHPTFGKRYFDLQEFKSLLQIDRQRGLKRYWNLKTRILLPAMKEITQNTDLQVFRCEEKRKSGRVLGFTVLFGMKPSAQRTALHKRHQKDDAN
jgi:plasmid replication initiation protein